MKIKFREFLYLSNLLSLTRIVLIIPFVYFIKQESIISLYWLTAISIMLILSDFLDGYFARKFNQVTELGIVLDPIADKIIMAVGLVMLILYRDFPIPIVIFLIYRDIMIVVIGWFTLRKINKPVMANSLGKLNTFIFAIAGFLSVIKIANFIFTFVIICAYIMTLASGISYGLIGARLLFNKAMQKTLYWIGIAVLTAIIIYFSLNFSWI